MILRGLLFVVLGCSCSASQHQYVDVSGSPAQALDRVAEVAERSGMCAYEREHGDSESLRVLSQIDRSGEEDELQELDCVALREDSEKLLAADDPVVTQEWDAITSAWQNSVPPNGSLTLSSALFTGHRRNGQTRILVHSSSPQVKARLLEDNPIQSVVGATSTESLLWDVTSTVGIGYGGSFFAHTDTMAHLGWRLWSRGGIAGEVRQSLGLAVGAGSNIETRFDDGQTQLGLRTGLALFHDRGNATLLLPGRRLATGRRLRTQLSIDAVHRGDGMGMELTASTEVTGFPKLFEQGNIGGYVRIGYRDGSAKNAEVSAGLKLGPIPTVLPVIALGLIAALAALATEDFTPICFRCESDE